MGEERPGDLGKMEELFEKRRQGKAESCIEPFLAKIGSIVRQFLKGHKLAIYQEDGYAIWDMKVISKLLL